MPTIKQENNGTLDNLTLTETNGTITASNGTIVLSNTVGDAHDLLGFVGSTSETIAVGDAYEFKAKVNDNTKWCYIGLSINNTQTYNSGKYSEVCEQSGNIWEIFEDDVAQSAHPIAVVNNQYYWFRIIFCHQGLVVFYKTAEDDPWIWHQVRHIGTYDGAQLYFHAQVYSNGGVLTIDYMKHDTSGLLSDNIGEIPIASDNFDDLSNWTVVEGDESISAVSNKMEITGGSSGAWDQSSAIMGAGQEVNAGDEMYYTLECSSANVFIMAGIALSSTVNYTTTTGIHLTTATKIQNSDLNLYTDCNIGNLNGAGAIEFRLVFNGGGFLLYYKPGADWEPIINTYRQAEPTFLSFPLTIYPVVNVYQSNSPDTYHFSNLRIITPVVASTTTTEDKNIMRKFVRQGIA